MPGTRFHFWARIGSPDGRWIACLGDDGRSVRREWTHDGERFYFTLAEQEADIWLMELSVD